MAYTSKNQKRIEQDEEELKELLKQASGDSNPEEEGNTTEDEVSTDKSASDEQPETEPDNEEEKTFKKRYGDLRRYQQQKDKEYKERIEELESKLEKLSSQPTEEEIPSTIRELEAWQEKNPKAASLMQTLIQQEAEKLFKEAKMDLETIKSEQKKAEKEKGLREIKKAHSDFDELQEDDEFHDWVEEQPKWVQQALYENNDDPKSVIRVLDLYKADMGLVKAKTKEAETSSTKAAASDVKTKGSTRVDVDTQDAGSKIRESWVHKLSAKEYEKNEDRIMEAMRSGNFVYDMTGGAR